jgi:hypothetical protein
MTAMNKQRLYYLLCLPVLIVFCPRCESVVDFPEILNHTPCPVIEAILTDQAEVQKVRVSYSVALDDSLASRPIEDARVRMISMAGDTVKYAYSADGWYESPVYAALHGIAYSLEVEIENVIYRSWGEVAEMNGIDSLYSRHVNGSSEQDTGIFVFFDAGQAFQEDTRYYLINLIHNNTLVTLGSELWIFNDKYVENINGIKLQHLFNENDTVVMELCSLSKDMFDYYFKLAFEVLGLNLSNISYRANLPQMFQPAALGYFQVSAISRREIVVKSTY